MSNRTARRARKIHPRFGEQADEMARALNDARSPAGADGRRGWMVRAAGLLALWWVLLLAPIGGLAVFWLLPFKPAVTLYAVIAGLGMALLDVVRSARVSLEIREFVRREMNGHYAR